VGSGNSKTTKDAKVLLQVRPTPVNRGLLEARGELSRAAVEDLVDSARKLLGALEGIVGDIDVDRKRLPELVVENWAEGGEDTLKASRPLPPPRWKRCSPRWKNDILIRAYC
jgi:hypothetical protein